jgi:hypothetical protein
MGRKLLRRVLGTVAENGVWRVDTNQEFMNLCRELYIIL